MDSLGGGFPRPGGCLHLSAQRPVYPGDGLARKQSKRTCTLDKCPFFLNVELPSSSWSKPLLKKSNSEAETILLQVFREGTRLYVRRHLRHLLSLIAFPVAMNRK